MTLNFQAFFILTKLCAKSIEKALYKHAKKYVLLTFDKRI